MNENELKKHVTSVLLNDTDRYWPRSDILDEVNNWVTSFPDQSLVEMSSIEGAILSLAFEDNLIDEREGQVKLNMRRYALSAVAQDS